MEQVVQKKVGIWLFALFITIAGLVGYGLNHHGLFDVDEAIFAEATQEMMARGDYVLPTYNDQPRYHKPPLTYWAQMAVAQVTDDVTLIARIPSAVFGFLTIFAFFVFIDKMTGRTRYALIASSILGLNMLFIGVARGFAPADAALNFFMVCITMGLLSNIYSQKPSLLTQVVIGFVCALGLLTKGPIAIAIPGAVVLFTVLVKEKPWGNLKRANPLIIGVFALLGLVPWAGAIIQTQGLAFFEEFLLVHNWQRFTSDLGNSHAGGWWYYLAVLGGLVFPWFWLVPSTFGWITKRFWRGLRGPDAAISLPVIGFFWMVIVVVVFSFSGTKLVHYVLPALPGMALMLAARLDDLEEKPLCFVHLIYLIPLMFLMAGFVWVFPYVLDILKGNMQMPALIAEWMTQLDITLEIDDPQVMAILNQDIPMLRLGFDATAALLIILGVPSLIFMASGRFAGLILLKFVSAVLTAWAAFVLIPVIWNHTQQPLAHIGKEIEQHYQTGDHLYFVEIHAPSVRLIGGVPFKEIPRYDLVRLSLPETREGRLMYLVEERLADEVQNQLHDRPNARKCLGGYCLVVAKNR